MTAIARAAPSRGEGMTTVHNSNSRKRKAPARTGAEKKDCMYAYDTRQRSRAQ
jgi:hypothetical protein